VFATLSDHELRRRVQLPFLNPRRARCREDSIGFDSSQDVAAAFNVFMSLGLHRAS
jgi:hypothetical protein